MEENKEIISEEIKEEKTEEKKEKNFSIKEVIYFAFATSIDALATGLVFIPYPNQLWIGIALIALVSFLYSLLGCFIASESGRSKDINAGLIGGIILIGIGVKIWIEGFLCS